MTNSEHCACPSKDIVKLVSSCSLCSCPKCTCTICNCIKNVEFPISQLLIRVSGTKDHFHELKSLFISKLKSCKNVSLLNASENSLSLELVFNQIITSEFKSDLVQLLDSRGWDASIQEENHKKGKASISSFFKFESTDVQELLKTLNKSPFIHNIQIDGEGVCIQHDASLDHTMLRNLISKVRGSECLDALQKKTTTVDLSIEGMTCSSCVNTVQSALRCISGVSFASVTLNPSKAIVQFDSSVISKSEIVDKIQSLGFN